MSDVSFKNIAKNKVKQVIFSENKIPKNNLKQEKTYDQVSNEIVGSYHFDLENDGGLPISIRSIELPILSSHEVVDVVPKPFGEQYGMNYKIPDQTIGIPITNNQNMQDVFSFRSNKPLTEIIHYPLISGNIPPYSSVIEKKVVKTSRTNEFMREQFHIKNMQRNFLNMPPLNITEPIHQHSNIKKDIGEKNKVKFSNTVTVVQVSIYIHPEINSIII